MAPVIMAKEHTKLLKGDILQLLDIDENSYRRLFTAIEERLKASGVITSSNFNATTEKERLLAILQHSSIQNIAVPQLNRRCRSSGIANKREGNKDRQEVLLTVAYRCIRNLRRRQQRRLQATDKNPAPDAIMTAGTYNNDRSMTWMHNVRRSSSAESEQLPSSTVTNLAHSLSFHIRLTGVEPSRGTCFTAIHILRSQDKQLDIATYWHRLQFVLFRRYIYEDLRLADHDYDITHNMSNTMVMKIEHERIFHTVVHDCLVRGDKIIEFTVSKTTATSPAILNHDVIAKESKSRTSGQTPSQDSSTTTIPEH